MTTAQKLAQFGAAFVLALTVVATAGPSLAFADEGDDPSAAPLVLEAVNGGIQQAAGATEFGLGLGQAASGDDGLGIGVQGTQVGAAVAGLGLGIPAGILNAQP